MLAENATVNTYVFQVELEQEEDGRWSAWIEALPGCATWGDSKEEALNGLREAAQAYVDVLTEHGWPLPDEAVQAAHVIPAPAVARTM